MAALLPMLVALVLVAAIVWAGNHYLVLDDTTKHALNRAGFVVVLLVVLLWFFFNNLGAHCEIGKVRL